MRSSKRSKRDRKRRKNNQRVKFGEPFTQEWYERVLAVGLERLAKKIGGEFRSGSR